MREPPFTCQQLDLCGAPLSKSSELWDRGSVDPGQPERQLSPTRSALSPQLHPWRRGPAPPHLTHRARRRHCLSGRTTGDGFCSWWEVCCTLPPSEERFWPAVCWMKVAVAPNDARSISTVSAAALASLTGSRTRCGGCISRHSKHAHTHTNAHTHTLRRKVVLQKYFK